MNKILHYISLSMAQTRVSALLWIVIIFGCGVLTTTSFAQTIKIAPNGDTLTLSRRVGDWRVGGFIAGEIGTDLGSLQLPIDLNNASKLGLYESYGFGNASGVNVGVEGWLHIAPTLTASGKLGFTERGGAFSFFPPANTGISGTGAYENAVATTILRGVNAGVSLGYDLGMGFQAYLGVNAVMTLLAQSRTFFKQTSIADTPPATVLPVARPIAGIVAGGRYLWRVRDTETSRISVIPFGEVQWQPNIAQFVGSAWSAVMVRLGVSLALTPVEIDTLQVRLFRSEADILAAKADSARAAKIAQWRMSADATQLPTSSTNDSVSAEQTFLYNVSYNAAITRSSQPSNVDSTRFDVLPKMQEFVQAILPDISSGALFRLTLTTTPEERELAEVRLQRVRAYLREHHIAPERVQSSIVERSILQTGQKLRVQILRY
jgi:hypothetical protein